MSVHVINPHTGAKPKEPGEPRKYRCRWRDSTGKMRSQTFDRKGDAEAFDLEKKRQRQGGRTARTADSWTLEQWRERRWRRDCARNLAASTIAHYDRYYREFIEKYLGHRPLSQITFDEIAEWQAELLDDRDCTPHTIQKARNALGSVLTHAVEVKVIPANPVHGVPRPKLEHRDEVTPLTPRQVEAIRARMSNPRDRIIVSVLAYAGLRPGELRALKRTDVRERTLLVQRGSNPDGTVKSTKTGVARTVRILPPLREDLDHWLSQPAQGPQLFPSSAGGPAWTLTTWANWRRNVWRPACKAAGMDPIPRPYDLRHSFASWLLAEGRPVGEVAAQLGHTAHVLLDVYGHVIAEYADLPAIDKPVTSDEITRAREEFQTGSRAEAAEEAA